jgi:Secretion system C-terminal sorting domain
MKKRILCTASLFIVLAGSAYAQTCALSCCAQSFPYDFCKAAGSVYRGTYCSTNPNADGFPAKTYFPGCVIITSPMPDGVTRQPNAIPPKPASYLGDEYFTSRYPATDSFDLNAEDGSWDQQIIDSIRFINNEPPLDPRDNPSKYPYTTDPGDEPSCCPDCPPDQFGDDSCVDWESYKEWYYYFLGAEDQYSADEDAWNANGLAYTTVWNQGQATTDAQSALNHWLGCCQPAITGDPSCCIQIILDTNATDFLNSPGVLAVTDEPTNCNEDNCTTMEMRSTRVNISSLFLNNNWQSDNGNDPSLYTLHTVHRTAWYTNPNHAPNLLDSYGAFSFFQLMEHELGHFLGLNHPEDAPTGGSKYSCLNCYTADPVIDSFKTLNPTGFHQVMAQGLNIAANSSLIGPLTLSSADSCQFEKLYCPAACTGSGVSVGENESLPSPEIHPNPSTAATELDYTITERSFVQIEIYDILGNAVKEVSSGYSNAGPQSISLGTETLPSGNYVCRVRVGDLVNYINLAITK